MGILCSNKKLEQWPSFKFYSMLGTSGVKVNPPMNLGITDYHIHVYRAHKDLLKMRIITLLRMNR